MSAFERAAALTPLPPAEVCALELVIHRGILSEVHVYRDSRCVETMHRDDPRIDELQGIWALAPDEEFDEHPADDHDGSWWLRRPGPDGGFFEEDESVEEVVAAFEAGEKLVTQDPRVSADALTPEVRAGIYRHWKGPLYQVLGTAHDADDPERTCVVYVGLQLDAAHEGPRLAVRTASEFTGLVHSDGSTCPDVTHCEDFLQRFQLLGHELRSWMLQR